VEGIPIIKNDFLHPRTLQCFVLPTYNWKYKLPYIFWLRLFYWLASKLFFLAFRSFIRLSEIWEIE
jgi:hypothetical protein